MNLKTRDRELYEASRRRLATIMGVVGVGGILEIVADLAQDYGDKDAIDPLWLAIAAQVQLCNDSIDAMLEN
jgi:hypothetical protein